MSLSNPKPQNPATKFIEFKGDKGIFQYYDKEKESNIEISIPVYFIVLDEFTTIKGYNNQLSCGIYSNEVKNLKTDILTVRDFKGNYEIIGKYNEIKLKIKEIGGEYCKSVYAALIREDKTLDFVNFQFRGASLSAWIDKKINIEQFAIGVTEVIEMKNGSIVFKRPVFKAYSFDENLKKKAVEMDRELQSYFESYQEFQVLKESESEQLTEEKKNIEEFEQDLNHEEYMESMYGKRKDIEKNNDNKTTNKLPF